MSTTIKTIYTDNGSKFLNHFISTLLQSKGILPQKTSTYTHQQNGVEERKHRHLLEVARALQLQPHLTKRFWSECVNCNLPHKPNASINSKLGTPYFRLFHKKPDYIHLKTFGCLCYASNTFPHRDKFSPRAIKFVYISYSHR